MENNIEKRGFNNTPSICINCKLHYNEIMCRPKASLVVGGVQAILKSNSED